MFDTNIEDNEINRTINKLKNTTIIEDVHIHVEKLNIKTANFSIIKSIFNILFR